MVKGYIDLNIDMQQSHYHKVDMNNVTFMVNYTFENITKEEEKDETLKYLQKRIVGNIALTMREND